MSIILPGEGIHFKSDTARKDFSGAVAEVIDDMEASNADLLDDIRIWWNNYEAVPRQSAKNFPFANSSNIVVPLAQMMVDATVSKTWSSIFGAGHRIWSIRTENEGNKELGDNVVRYVNWQADGNAFNARLEFYDHILEQTAIGSSVLEGNWVTDEQWTWGKVGGTLKPIPTLWNRGPVLSHIPREFILWDTNFLVGQAPIVVREFRKSLQQLFSDAMGSAGTESERKERAKLLGWDLDALSNLKAQDGGGWGPSEEVRSDKAKADSRDARKLGRDDDQDVRQVHLDWAMLDSMGVRQADFIKPGTIYGPVVVTHHRKQRTNLQVRAEPYHWPGKPFFDSFYKKRSGRGHSVGLVKKLEMMQAAMTTTLNQSIDAQTRANMVWATTSDKGLAQQPIDGSTPIHVPSGSNFEPFALQGAQFGNIQMWQVMQGMAERLAGAPDPTFGKETRMGGHPSPATSTLALMQNADLLGGPNRDLLRQALNRAGEFVATLDQQFETDLGRIAQILGERDAETIEPFLFPDEPIPGNYQFNIRALSQDLNPDAAMQRAVTVSQMNTNYWSTILNAVRGGLELQAQGLDEGTAQIVAAAISTFVKAQTNAHKQFLEAADVDDIENFILALDRGAGQQTQALQQFSTGLEQLAGPNAGPPGAGTNGTGQPIGGGTGVPPGQVGIA
ncbi:MAG: hypothetical protein GY737_00360 [Desulfobacteraceae bacterium]|nr:hypothetical protein [Desulfobacteraceae bacterium]